VLLQKTTEAQARWNLAARALDAFVREDDETLAPLCCTSAPAKAPQDSADSIGARHTIALIEAGDTAFSERCRKDPQLYVTLAQGLQRWLTWTKTAPSRKLWLWLAAAAVKKVARHSSTT
jgi:hypothetical protein|tara:strand:- start:607 stop:966 length:360 start_codon:yes stop_codon:yes gene_type:complete